ncbi:DUF4239 domain-containing protein [Roseateles amylovorans]|jgi:Protein of unknown function (DUF4239)|uniref:DUF4239 domain-containing protein n=1 Tax=Roseateles amylovorans TaxID=2978473 RepID=A0ABY6B891_9BURK|nr:DUF4239 domain-containing protein [Roseateles amylovorans]UXH79432.1 DUF4239 domain-containing protein [Roseateles amylovorans]
MPLWFYTLPNGLFGLIIVAGWLCVGLGGLWLCQRWQRQALSDAERSLSLALMGLVTVLNTLLLAVCAFSVWTAFTQAESAVRREASAISELSRELAVINTPESRLAREQLRAYARAVVNREWQAMRDEQHSQVTWDAFDTLFRSMADIQPGNTSDRLLLPQIWVRVNELLKSRQERLEASRGQLPGTLWAVAVLSTLLTLGLACVLAPVRCHRAAITGAALAIGLVFFFVAAMDRPFVGRDRVSARPIEACLTQMERWEVRAPPLDARR